MCVCISSCPPSSKLLHLGWISERKYLYCPFARVKTHTHIYIYIYIYMNTHLTDPGAWSDHLSGRWQAEEAHQGLTRDDQRVHYHAYPLSLALSPLLSLPFKSNKKPAGLSLCLLGCDNRTCPQPKEMNYLPRSLLYSWKKINPSTCITIELLVLLTCLVLWP